MSCMIPFISSSKIVKVICGVRSKDRPTTQEKREGHDCFQMLPNVPQMPKLPQDENHWSKLATREIQDGERGLNDSL